MSRIATSEQIILRRVFTLPHIVLWKSPKNKDCNQV